MSQESAPRLRRRRVKEESAASVVPSILQVSPEVIAAREARLAAEEAAKKATLLIQSHERARIARIAATERQFQLQYRPPWTCDAKSTAVESIRFRMFVSRVLV